MMLRPKIKYYKILQAIPILIGENKKGSVFMIYLENYNHNLFVVDNDIKIENDKVYNFVYLYLGSKERIIFKYKKTGQSSGDYFIDTVWGGKEYEFTENEKDSLAIKQIKDLQIWINEKIKSFCLDKNVSGANIDSSVNMAIAKLNAGFSSGEVPVDNYYIDLADYKGELPKEYV